MRELGLLSLLSQASVYVPEELRESIEMAIGDSPYVDHAERVLARIEFVTINGNRSSDMMPDDRY